MNEADFRQGARKEATRKRTLAAVQQCPTLWKDGKLQCDWLELSGLHDPMLQMLLDLRALTPGRFIGISRKADIIGANKEHFKEACSQGQAGFFQKELEEELTDMSSYPRVGVLVFDGFTSVANLRLQQALVPLFNFARTRAARRGQVLFVSNLVERANVSRDITEATAAYKTLLNRLLGFEVPEEHFERYKGEGRFRTMLLHRILFTTEDHPAPENVTVWKVGRQ